MKIARCSTAVVEANYDYTFVRIEAEDGTYGTGECFFAPGLTAALADMFPLLIGRDPREIDRLARMLWRKGSGAGAVAGYLFNAVSGIETALFDLVGKIYGVPCYQLLGGRMHPAVRIYADCHAGDNLESWGPMLIPRRPRWLAELVPESDDQEERYEPAMYRRRAEQMVAAGFTALKFDIDSIITFTGEELLRPITTAEIETMADCVGAAREGAGPDVDLAVDCHWRFSPSDALRISRALAPHNLMWIEDPCPPENWRDMADLRAGSPAPILTGENLNRRHGFWDLVVNRAVDIVAPDVQKCGGMLEAKRIGELAELQGIRFAPHNIASPLGVVAAAHVCITLPNFVALEFHGADVPFWDALIRRPDRPEALIEQGFVYLDEAPGLGCELVDEVAREHAKPGERWFDESAVEE